MAQFKAKSPVVQVNGETVLSIVDGMGAFKSMAITILSDCGIKNPTPGQWYPQQAWLDAFKIISDKIGKATLTKIGNKIPENAKFPPTIDNIEKALSSIDIAYHMNHKGGEIGHYNYHKVSDKSAKLVCDNPYPCEFDRGIIEAMAKKFRPPTSLPRILHDDKAPCRKDGAESCTYHVEW